MKNLLVCHSRCGSTSLFKNLISNSPKKIVWGVDDKGWSYDKFLSNDYHMARCNVQDNSIGHLSKLCWDMNCSYMYRKNIHASALSLAIGNIKKVWDFDNIGDDYYSNKIYIDKGNFLNSLMIAVKHREMVLYLSSVFGGVVFTYEEFYSGPTDVLNMLNNFHNLDLDIESCEKDISETKKLNDYTNIHNMEEIQGWIDEHKRNSNDRCI